MRLDSFLLVVVTLAVCCHRFANADGTATIKNLETDSNREFANGGNEKRYLKGTATKTLATDEEREFPGLTKLKNFLNKMPYLNKLKTGGGNNPVKIAVAEVKEIMQKERHASVSVLISLLKMLAVVGVISVTSGYIIYRTSN